ncbi:immunoglobulin superfamily member 5 [Trematomus bernacchii]|uniref:immunoglobulin superfamily member 5 n=1 Tax=Trematomus bernacchii TaxID=40690 RepID=UPI00146AF4CE|nr:immunoglobulin superfamily member 5 [Trematomus bernacchii]
MSASWRSQPNLLLVCLLLSATGAVSGQFQLEPLNATVLHGSAVRFNATVQGAWKGMTWTVGGHLVTTVIGDIISSSEQFSARFCSSGDPSCVEFTIENVTRREGGAVTCSVQGNYGSKTAQLYVQESGTVNIMGGNVTVTQDEQVEFQCVSSKWFPIPTVSWTWNSEAVNSSLYNTTSMADGDFFNCTSVLKFQAVRDTQIECWATVETLASPQSSSVYLVVVPKPTDWTVLIAVVVSIGSFALLVLLIIGIIFCYKRRKEKKTKYEDEMSRRVRTQSQISTVHGAGQNQGQENTGYVSEGQTSVAPTELTDSGFFPANGSTFSEMPDVVNSTHTGNAYITVEKPAFRKHRHVTIV